MLPLSGDIPKDDFRDNPTSNFRSNMVLKNCAKFCCNLKVVYCPLPEISPMTFLELDPTLRIFVPKWCQKVVLILCEIVLQFLNFMLFTFLENVGLLPPETPTHTSNFRSKMLLKNCANFVLNCVAIFKFCVPPFRRYPQERFLS